jgi:glycosyltransferase involved in cell wall biosynthesis
MNKVFILRPSEDWIVDRLVAEWYEDNSNISVTNSKEADVIWLLASWCWQQLAFSGQLSNKKVITTIHHIVPEKFGQNELNEFLMRDNFTTVYHVTNQITKNFITRLTNKPIHLISYWANQKIWKITGDKKDLREKYNLPMDGYLIGSFQRDTEGNNPKVPKLEKGPDLLADAIEKMWKTNKNIHVVLAGWRRQYIISRLNNAGIPFSYFEKPQQDIINELYQTLDLYPVTARYEGGPQSLIECGLLNIPVVSRDIGIARQVLSEVSISDDVTLATPSIPVVDNLKLPLGYLDYINLINSL